MQHIDTPAMTRTQILRGILYERGMGDRSGEWFKQSMFPPIGKEHADEPVIVRRSLAIKAMLEAMTNPQNSKTTNSYEIKNGELIVGVIPLGSVGLGKEFPKYLTDDELRLASFSHRDVESVFGHNCPDFTRVLEKGLQEIIQFCNARMEFLHIECDHPLDSNNGAAKKLEFYRAVKIASEAVIAYAERYAQLAEEQAATADEPNQKAELLEIARICRKVPAQPADTFHEALQCVYFIHLALHSTMNLMSLGRLDQVLQPYYENSDIPEEEASELLECFFLKCGERQNLTKAYLIKQDHMDFGTALGTNPIFLDQIASANNFMQNIVIGGKDRSGNDACNDCTRLFLQACKNIAIATPTLNIRIHKNTDADILEAIFDCQKEGKNGLPIIYNDDVVVPGLMASGIPEEEALDYVVDGCWEPILNAKGDWTFGMIHMLTVMECALNSGNALTNNSAQLTGKKLAYATPDADNILTFDQLLDACREHIRFFTDQVALRTYNFYTIEGSVTPTPLFSALLGDCLKKGIDKTWGGADYIIGGIIAIAVPNAANSLAAIKKYVFDEKVYTLAEVREALRHNFSGNELMQKRFQEAPKYGNNDAQVDGIMKWLMDEFYSAVREADKLADQIFLKRPDTQEEQRRIENLRHLCGYAGPSMKEKFGDHFNILFTAGAGTFGQYASMGGGCAASADGRGANQPVAPNCSPEPGTIRNGIGNMMASMTELGLERFGAGVVTDICLDDSLADADFIVSVMQQFVENNGNILTISLASAERLQEAYELCEKVRQNQVPPNELKRFADLSVRVGGWNAPFISLPKAQQENYITRILK